MTFNTFLILYLSIFHKANSQVAPTTESYENTIHQPRHLLDDSVIEGQLVSDATSTESSEGAVCVIETGKDYITQQQATMSFHGCVRRKTVLKDGRKPAVASWQRYWLQIWANSLIYFPPKSFKGFVLNYFIIYLYINLYYTFLLITSTERGDFKREPCKVCSLDGWTAQLLNNPQQQNTFQLINSSLGTVYKFRTGSALMTTQWIEAIKCDSIKKLTMEKQLPINLMTFE